MCWYIMCKFRELERLSGVVIDIDLYKVQHHQLDSLPPSALE